MPLGTTDIVAPYSSVPTRSIWENKVSGIAEFLNERPENLISHLNMIFDVPMILHEKPKFSAAVSRTNNGPDAISLSYKTSVNGTWTTDGLSEYAYELNTEFDLIELDFEHVEEAKNNADFQIKIEFKGNTTSNSGNVRFNNVTVEAFPLRGDDLITSIPDFPKEKTLPILNKVYPNPFSEKLSLMINEKELNNISSIQILDSRGVEVMRLENIPHAFEELDMSHISSGLYILKVVTKTNLETYKIIKK
ncbi:MAG TPA: T9SS type A sorting domain-containing protein [Lunatimonas sp.]|nr:T9SS type A sorting domain-containing protein [Lunatimonas sp.]